MDIYNMEGGRIYWFWLLLLQATTSLALCPAQCRCPRDVITKPWLFCENANLKTLPDGQFDLLTREFTIAHNNFTTLSYEQFSRFPMVRALYLQHNAFSIIDEETTKVITSFEKLEAINLSHNPLDCRCSDGMKTFLSWLKNKQTENIKATTAVLAILDGYATLCHAPQRLKGQRLDRLELKDVCSE